MMFLNFNSLLLVIGGTLTATMISYHGRYVFKTILVLFRFILKFKVTPQHLSESIFSLIEQARYLKSNDQKDFLTHFNSQLIVDDNFFRYAMTLTCIGSSPEKIKENLTHFTQSTYERGMVQVHILDSMAG